MARHIRNAFLFAVAAAVLLCAGVLRAEGFVSPSTGANQSIVAGDPAIPTNVTPFTREQLLSVLTREVGAHFNFEGELQLDLMRPWSPPARLASRWDLAVIEYPSVPSSSLMLRCRVIADGANVTETTFVVRAQLWRDAWVTRQPLTVGAAFDPSILETRRVDVLRERDALPAAVGDQTYVFARAVPAGRQLTWRDISRRPLVRKGDLVEVAATEGLLVVTMKALAMENGARGDIVTVRNPESRKDFAAKVVDENRVQVQF